VLRTVTFPPPPARFDSVLVTLTDLTERKCAQEELRRSQYLLAESQRQSHAGSWALNPFTLEHDRSDEAARILGYDPQGPKPAYAEILDRIHPQDQPYVRRTVNAAIAERRDIELEYRYVRSDGSLGHHYSVGHPVLNEKGELVEYVGTVLDITDRKRAEQALQKAQAELAHMSRVTTMIELTASLAHEINQPIAAAVTNASACVRWLARAHPEVEEARAAASRMMKDATRAADIIGRIRALFKKGPPQRELVDVNEVIREMIVLLRSEATRYSISLHTELAAGLAKVAADRVQLQQVLMNLMLNGIDAMKNVAAGAELTVKTQRTENDQLLVSICDTGVGLPRDQADRIFNAFFTTKADGTGMGLPISRSIIESHGGRLWAIANQGAGATFCFTLPVKGDA
jgi:PAS domain S-box-containing protein